MVSGYAMRTCPHTRTPGSSEVAEAPTGPRGYSGIIGKQLPTCDDLPLASFLPVESNVPSLPSEIVQDLSSDQKYLYEICEAVNRGDCSIDLSRRDPGPVSHARWITTANRLLRLYIGTENPTEELRTIVEYILCVYAPTWFIIKCNPSSKDGSKHLWQTIAFARYLPSDLKEVVFRTIQRNAYFASPENMLLAMMHDNRQHIRELAIRRILKAREHAAETYQHKTRVFEIPSLNFDSVDYVDLIWWQDCDVTATLSEEELWQFVTDEREVPKFPCHTQSVERNIKLVTEASSSVCGAEAREGFIRNKIFSRSVMPAFETNAAYKPNK